MAAAESQIVFISLHGEDVPEEVPSYLKSSLEGRGFSVFKRDNTGSEDRRTVLNKIWESSFVLVIFSVGFAKSGECLDELVMVKKRMNIGKLSVIPIYYKMEPKDVTHVRGLFSTMLKNLETEEHETVVEKSVEAILRAEVRFRNWREALASFTATSDFIYREEDGFIETIIKQVYKPSARDDDDNIIENSMLMSQITVKDRMEALVSTLRSLGLVFDGNDCSESNSIDKLTEELKKQLTEKIPKMKQKISKFGFERGSVYISFSGRSTRRTIVSHLLAALTMDGIEVIINDTRIDFANKFELIRNSSIAVVIFSEDYAESKWCMNELTEIKRNFDKGTLKVIPIFYNVNPSDVRKQRGRFGEYLKKLTTSTDEATVLKWQEALRSVVDIMGVVSTGRDEKDIIDDIIHPISVLSRN